ncbi:MAG: hypothetical protein JXA54_01260 [Candidatus Heimdallarchaeota archaeon]|nr:hypothetical protein [Candidatus Heimdallarchaeota archaeon]
MCKLKKPLIKKSHIIPDFFFKEIGAYNDKHKIHRINVQEYIKNKKITYTSTGEYEGDILCKECDGEIIGSLESYGRKVLYGGLSKSENIECKNFKNPKDGFEFSICENVDYKKFKLFLLSILWRSCISNREMFKEALVKRCHLRRIRKMILNSNPGEIKDYPIVILSYGNDSKMPKDLVFQPIKSVSNRRTIITFLIGGYVFIFNITNRKKILERVKDISITLEGRLPIMFFPKDSAWEFIFKYANIL